MPGNVRQADYGLVIRGETIAHGCSRLADALPSFRNTLVIPLYTLEKKASSRCGESQM